VNFLRMLTEAEWQRVRTRGRRRYVWAEHVLPLGLPIGVLITAQRYVDLRMSWTDIFTSTGVEIAYVSIAASMLIMAGWGLLVWRVRERSFSRKNN
jgi:hypothetical protein